MLHSILFHRLFGTIRSRTFEVLDVTMVSPLRRLYACFPPVATAYMRYHWSSSVMGVGKGGWLGRAPW